MNNQQSGKKKNIISGFLDTIFNFVKLIRNKVLKIKWNSFASGLFGAIIGALIGLTPFIREEFCVKPEIKGKIMGIVVNPKIDSLVLLDSLPSFYGTYKGSLFIFRFSLTSLHKDMIFSKVEASIKLHDDRQVKGIIFYVQNDSTIKDRTKYIQFINTFPKNEATLCYLNILLSDIQFKSADKMNFKEVIINFYDYENTCYSTILKSKDMDTKSIMAKFD